MQKNIYLIPLAIIIAGGFIGGGLALGLSKVAGSPQQKQGTETQRSEDIVIRPVTKEDHIRGDASAPITLVEYSDLECPFCKRFHPVMQQVIKEYKGKVRWVYRHLPLAQLHSKASNEAQAAECASEQGKFWEYVDHLYEITPANNGLDAAQLPEIAQFISLDIPKFTSCLQSEKYAKKVDADLQEALGIGNIGTPTTILIDSKGNKTPLEGALPYERIKAVIDSKL